MPKSSKNIRDPILTKVKLKIEVLDGNDYSVH